MVWPAITGNVVDEKFWQRFAAVRDEIGAVA